MIDTVESIEGIIGGEQQLEGSLNVSKIVPILQEKTTTPTEEIQNIIPDENYDGLSKVVVNAIPEQYIIPSGTINITEDGTYDVKQYETAQVDVPSGVLQEKSIEITQEGTTIVLPDEGYDGISKLTIITEIEDTYTDLDYLYCPLSHYIPTNIPARNNIEVEIKFAPSNANNRSLFGTQDGGNYYHLTLYGGKYYWGLDNAEGNGGSIQAGINNPHIAIFNNDNSKVVADGNVIGDCTGTTSTKNLDLFRRLLSVGSYVYYIGRVYYIKVRDKSTNTLLLDLVPKQRDKDNKIGFYDNLTRNFYLGEGEGEFSYQ